MGVTLRALVSDIESTKASIAFLRKRVPSTVKIVLYQNLKGKTRTQIFKGLTGLIVLVPKKGTKSGHYVALIPRKNHIEYFSSLGGSMESELNQLDEPLNIMRNILGQGYKYNRVQLQRQSKYSINTCGAWVLARTTLAKLKQREFVQLFRTGISLRSPDDTVSLMCLLPFATSST